MVMLATAWLTLFERHLLSSSQERVGPSKISIKGVLQPVVDGLKLLSQEFLSSSKSKLMLSGLFNMIGFLVMIVLWYSLPNSGSNLKLKGILLLMGLSLVVYSSMIMSLQTKSKYPSLGGIRMVASMVSVEAVILVLILILFLLWKSMEVEEMLFLLSLPVITMTLLTVVALEVGRTPFDLSEGESELVSGFNTELGSTAFTLLFLAEYGFILYWSTWLSSTTLKSGLFTIFFLWILIAARATFPRMRYDKSLSLFWLILVPSVTLSLGLIFVI